MKTHFLKTALLVATALFFSCSKDDDATPTPEPANTKLVLPAVLENNILFDVPNGNSNGMGGCGITTNPGIAESTIIIDKDGKIADATKVSVELELSDLSCGEVVIQLVTPTGESCALIKRPEALADDNCGSTSSFIMGNKLSFNSAYTNVSLPNQIPTGNYAPLVSNASTYPTTVPEVSLDTFFTGKNIKGTWKIKAYDYGGFTRLKLHSWKLKFDVGALQ